MNTLISWSTNSSTEQTEVAEEFAKICRIDKSMKPLESLETVLQNEEMKLPCTQKVFKLEPVEDKILMQKVLKVRPVFKMWLTSTRALSEGLKTKQLMCTLISWSTAT